MTKKEFAATMVYVQMLDKLNHEALDGLAGIISSAFSALGTMEPDIAVNILDQLNEKRGDLLQLQEEREKEIADMIEERASLMSSTIEFDDEEVEN